ncbi:MAG: ABC transporter permease, partial [Calditrichota bacterium]
MRKLSAIIFQEFHQTLRHPTRGIIPILFFGLFAYLGIALGYTELVTSINGVPTIRWMIPGLVLFSVMILAYQNGLWRVVEKESNGYLAYLRSTTASEGLLTSAYLLFAILRALFGAALVVILFWVLWGEIGTITQWLIFFGVAAVTGIFWAGLGISLALLFKPVSLNSHILIEFFLPLLIFSGLLYPVTYYPEAMAIVTQVLPSTQAFSLARAPFGIGSWDPWLGL